MKDKKLILEKKEYIFIKRLINTTNYVQHIDTKIALITFLNQIDNAAIIDEQDMPADVIRFNKKITILSNNGLERELEIVIPSEKNIKENKISILTPLAAALFGYSKVDVLEFKSPIGLQTYKVLNVSLSLNSKNIEVII